MPKVARVTDMFVGACACCPGPSAGMLISGSDVSKASGLQISRIGDIGIGFCGHIAIVVTGSAVTNADGIPVTRVGDLVSGCITGVIITGDPVVDVLT